MNIIHCLQARNALSRPVHLARPLRNVNHRVPSTQWLISSRSLNSLRLGKPRTGQAQREKHRNRRQEEADAHDDKQKKPSRDDSQPPPPRRDTPFPTPQLILKYFVAYTIDLARQMITYGIPSFVIAHFVATHFYSVTLPTGASMLPTMHYTGECVIISKYYKYGNNIKVGDIVCALHPLFPDGHAVIKRVVGMPGDFVWIAEGYEHADPLVGWVHGEEGKGRMVQVPRGHCWLSGDNWGFSRDSRHYGAVPLGLVIGKASWRILPLKRFGAMENGVVEVEEGVFA